MYTLSPIFNHLILSFFFGLNSLIDITAFLNFIPFFILRMPLGTCFKNVESDSVGGMLKDSQRSRNLSLEDIS